LKEIVRIPISAINTLHDKFCITFQIKCHWDVTRISHMNVVIRIDSSIMANWTYYYYTAQTLIHTILENNSHRVINTTVCQMRNIDKQLIKLQRRFLRKNNQPNLWHIFTGTSSSFAFDFLSIISNRVN
jgi:hypothetical protein